MSEDNLSAIAVIGMAGRFPGAPTLDAFWDNLRRGVKSITHFRPRNLRMPPAGRFRSGSLCVREIPLDGAELFDAGFFNFLPREAELTDPQQRVFLEIAWEALESAGYDPAAFPGEIAVYAGSSIDTYLLYNVLSDRRRVECFTGNYQVAEFPTLVGNGADFIATRTAYKLDLRGPAFTVQSACSTSLLAVAEACQCLLDYRADMALAGGVSITFPQKRGYLYQEGGMVSPDGHCRSFDADAAGTVFGSGAGVVATEAARRRPGRRRSDPRGHSRQRGQQRRRQESRLYGAQQRRSGKGDRRSPMPWRTSRPMPFPMSSATAPRPRLAIRSKSAASPRRFARRRTARVFARSARSKRMSDISTSPRGRRRSSRPFFRSNMRACRQHCISKAPIRNSTSKRARFTSMRSSKPGRAARGHGIAGVNAAGVGGTNVHVIVEEAPVIPAAAATEEGAAQLFVLSARDGAALADARSRLAAHIEVPSGTEPWRCCVHFADGQTRVRPSV